MYIQTTRVVTIVATLAISHAALGQMAEEAWLNRYNGEANMNDYARALSLDSQGNAIVTGFMFVQVDDNLFSPRWLTIKYDPDGNELWVRTFFEGFGSAASSAEHVEIDGDDNVIVAGAVAGGDDWAIVKYDAAGNELWTEVIDLNSSYLTEPDDLAVDGEGNIYLTGEKGAGEDVAVTVKYDADGNQQWMFETIGPVFEGAFGEALAVDDAGSVYVAGATLTDDHFTEIWLTKLDADGDEVWLRTFGSPGQVAIDRAEDVLIDHDGNIVVAGILGINTSSGTDAVVLKYTPGGDLLWDAPYGTVGEDDAALAVEIDSQNNVLIAGYATIEDIDALALKYDADGKLLWDTTIAGDGDDFDVFRALSMDAEDNVYLTGTIAPTFGNDFFLTARVDSDGSIVWQATYGGPAQGGSFTSDIAVDESGNVYISGYSPGSGTQLDFVTVKYEQVGDDGSLADLTDMQIVSGSLLNGSLESLLQSDDSFVHTRSVVGFTAFEPNLMEMVVGAQADTVEAQTMGVTIESSINHPVGTGKIRFRNWATDQFEQVATHELSFDETVETFSDIDATNYIRDTDDRIEFSVKHVVIATFTASGFDSFFDHVVIGVQK